MFSNPNNELIGKVLKDAKSIAIVGLSPNESRTSHQIAKAMQDAGYKIIPVNPLVDQVLGEKSYYNLNDIPFKVDIVNVFRRSEFLKDVAKDMIKTDFKVFWAQQGVYNEDAATMLNEHDKIVIMDLCIKVAHSVLVK